MLVKNFRTNDKKETWNEKIKKHATKKKLLFRLLSRVQCSSQRKNKKEKKRKFDENIQKYVKRFKSSLHEIEQKKTAYFCSTQVSKKNQRGKCENLLLHEKKTGNEICIRICLKMRILDNSQHS